MGFKKGTITLDRISLIFDNTKKRDETIVKKESLTHNNTFAFGRVYQHRWDSADSFMKSESFVLRINISSAKPSHRKSVNR